MATRIKTKRVPATTNNLTTAIINHINLSGGFAFRVNTQGTYSEALKRYIKSGAQKGVSDIIVIYNGRVLFLEVKNELTKDKISADQIYFKAKAEEQGAVYSIVTNLLDGKIAWTSFRFKLNA